MLSSNPNAALYTLMCESSEYILFAISLLKPPTMASDKIIMKIESETPNVAMAWLGEEFTPLSFEFNRKRRAMKSSVINFLQ